MTYNTGQITQAHAFLNWLDAHGGNLGTCGQFDSDTWHAEHREHERRSLRGFLSWAMSTGAMPRLSLPKQQLIRTAPMSQHARLTLIRRAATSTDAPLEVRVAALLMLLYAQAVSRLTRLILDDVLDRDGQVFLQLGDPPTPGSRTLRQPAPAASRQPPEHEHRHQPGHAMALPRPTRWPATQRRRPLRSAPRTRLPDQQSPPRRPRAGGVGAEIVPGALARVRGPEHHDLRHVMIV
ncbi:hypothetical protein ACSNOI_31850 [Actinomadura kijaniata]|uniref:hypothetical protein n=1 Tax=Actinomadura kijaniata TaxID=46161 RepID=UPI003F1D881B